MRKIFTRSRSERPALFAVFILAALILSASGSVMAGTDSSTGTAISRDGLEIAWEMYGPQPKSGSTPALVLVHGWCCDRSYWRNQVEGLADRFTIVTIDLGGHGQSGTDRKEWTMELFSADVACVVESLGLGRVILVGHSMGGPVIAGAAPVLGEKVAGLIGVDTYQALGRKLSPEQQAGFLNSIRNDFPGTMGMIVRTMFRPDADSELLESIVADMSSAPAEVGTGALAATLAVDPFTLYAQLAVPVTAINSDKYPTDVGAARALIPQFELKVVEGCGHFLMLEDPARFNALLAETATEIAGRE